MTLPYGFVRSRVTAVPGLKASKRPHEIQYHLHATLKVSDKDWDIAINVGTNDADDLLQYRLVYDFHHPIVATLNGAKDGKTDLTNKKELPALDFLRSDILKETGRWRISDVMDGTEHSEPFASLLRLFRRAADQKLDVYVFGRFYSEGSGIHDTHMNQGSGKGFIHKRGSDKNDHNDIWQDGAVFVNLGEDGWAAYFAAFEQQYVPTDDLGNPEPGSEPVS